jgi:hypothetical protein
MIPFTYAQVWRGDAAQIINSQRHRAETPFLCEEFFHSMRKLKHIPFHLYFCMERIIYTDQSMQISFKSTICTDWLV